MNCIHVLPFPNYIFSHIRSSEINTSKETTEFSDEALDLLYSKEKVEKEEIIKNCTKHEECQEEFMNSLYMCIHSKCIKVTKCLTSDSCPIESECLGGHCIITDEVRMGWASKVFQKVSKRSPYFTLFQDDRKKCIEGGGCSRNYQCYMKKQVCFYNVCDNADNRCPGDMTCVGSKCVGQPCLDSGKCPQLFTCILGKCLPKV